MTAAQAIRLCETCFRFEWKWRKGERPRIEDELELACSEDRPQLLEDLLRIELELRSVFEDDPSADDYRERFPDRLELIKSIFDNLRHGDESPTLIRSVGRYKLLEEIGRGRQGVVFRAIEDGPALMEVAVKLLNTGSVGTLDHWRRFVGETRALDRVPHSNIVPLLASGDDRGQLYYAMRYIRGPSLARLLKDRPGLLDLDEAIDIFAPIVQAVRYLHDRGIVHRDLKPGNILLDETGLPYVADFGLAFFPDLDEAEPGVFGTRPYIAPEQDQSQFGAVGPKVDVYSLGVILYEMLAGQPPFSPDDEATLRSLEIEPRPPSRLRSGIPEVLDRICLKCLRKSTKDRYDSAQLSEDLHLFKKNEPLRHALPESAWQRFRNRASREPALFARLAVLLACSTILWSYPLLVGGFAPLAADHWARKIGLAGIFGGNSSVEFITVVMNQAILIAWGLASWAFQRRLNQDTHDGGLQFGWRVVDVTVLSLLIQIDDALMSPLTVAFAVLIVSSAFWARAVQVIQTTVLSMTGYIILAVFHSRSHPFPNHSYRHFHYLIGLACLGAMLAHQVNRTRALIQICESRNRP